MVSSIEVSMNVDVPGSMGKLVMRYRMVFAAFPLVIVALVLRKQFKLYDDSGKCQFPELRECVADLEQASSSRLQNLWTSA